MNIGNTPREQLATIKYIYKKAAIVSLIFVVFAILGMIRGGIFLLSEFSSGFSLRELIGIGIKNLVSLPLFAVSSTGLVWAFYWLKGRLRPESLIKIGAMAVNSIENSGNTYTVYNDGITNNYTITKKRNWLPTIICAVLFFYVVEIIGVVYAIKYAMLGVRLQKELAGGQEQEPDYMS